MKQLVLRHHAEPDGTNPTITVIYQDPTTFQQETVGPFPFVLDFSDESRERLRWYLEEYLQCPLAVYRERALQAEAQMETLSAGLFEAVFKERAAYDLYRNVRDTLSETRIVVQANTSGGIALPWELIRDPGLTYGELAYQAHSFVRGEPNIPNTVAPPPQGSALNILLAISRPDDEKDVAFQSVARHLLEAFENQAGRVNIEVLRPATFTELARRLQEKPNHYHVFHFDGHGTFQGAPAHSSLLYQREGLGGKLYFEDGLASGQEEDGLISGERLGRVLAQAKVPIVLLNACQSGMVDPGSELVSLGNELLRSGACGVVAMSYSVYVQTAAAFMKSLYERLRAGDDLAGAHKKAVAALKDNPRRKSALGTDENLQDWVVPVLFERVAVTPLTKTASSSGTGSETTNETAEFALPKPPEYGFHGRDTITLKLERAFQNNTVALLWGMAGVGKTTTATAFARWRARTGALEGPVFFFSFEHHKTLAAVIGEIGRAYHKRWKARGEEWEHYDEGKKREEVVALLTQIPCFVIFDNFEPVSGFPTGTPSVWTDTEQAELKEFLSDLITRKAASKVLVTSRRKAEPVVPACPVVPLGGLPRHEALEMAGAILTRHGLNQVAIKKLPSFDKLLTFLNGNPLALQVMLPVLADGTRPDVLLTRLQAGTLNLPESDTTEQGRDKSLTASLTYRLESMSTIDIARLSIVGLFQGFVSVINLAQISSATSIPKEFRGLSIKKWTQILSSAVEIGLMQDMGSDGGIHFRIHPALSWFFHEKLIARFGKYIPKLELLFIESYTEYSEYLVSAFTANAHDVINVIDYEESNLLKALNIARIMRRDEFTSGILFAIEKLWTTQGRLEELEHLLLDLEYEVQDSNGQPKDSRNDLWIRCLEMRSVLLYYYRDFHNKIKIHERLVEYYMSISDELNLASSLHEMGIAYYYLHDFPESKALYLQSLEISRRIGYDAGVANTLHQLGNLLLSQPMMNLGEVERYYRESLEIRQRIGDETEIATSLFALSHVAEKCGKFDDAVMLCHQSLEIRRHLHNIRRIPESLLRLGQLLIERGNVTDSTHAEKLFRECLSLSQKTNNNHAQAHALNELGNIKKKQNYLDEAYQWYESSALISENNSMDVYYSSIFNMGSIEESRGDREKALLLYEKSESIVMKTKNLKNIQLIKEAVWRITNPNASLRRTISINFTPEGESIISYTMSDGEVDDTKKNADA
ncbi:CHAT domain-containing protein [Armatimonas sp.]|uniref:CHAT domain-containing protein n=1 Tax=Armatimonas sp. TaxID=1872638 RepID=UPI00286C92E6|nr:CHAT domain-containing protein [Armatimonas sp.]